LEALIHIALKLSLSDCLYWIMILLTGTVFHKVTTEAPER